MSRADRQVGGGHEAGDVLEPHLLHLAGGDVGVDVQPARRNVDPQFGHRGHGVDALGVDRPRDAGDRAVPAGRREPVLVEEHHAERSVAVEPVVGVRWRDETAVHVGVAARLVDQERAYVVEVVLAVVAPIEHGLAARGRDAADHDPERLASGVVVDRADHRRAVDVAGLGVAGLGVAHETLDEAIFEAVASALVLVPARVNCITPSATGALAISLRSAA